jgi:hypothetical protein
MTRSWRKCNKLNDWQKLERVWLARAQVGYRLWCMARSWFERPQEG